MGFRWAQLSTTQPGLRPRELDQSARRDLMATLRRRELRLAGLDCWIPPGHLREPTQQDRAVHALLAAIELAADLGCCPVSVHLPEQCPDEVLQALVAATHHRGVQLADHHVPPASSSELGVGIDPAAWLAGGADPVAGVLEAPAPPVSARLVDLLRTGVRGPVGDQHEGQLDVVAYRVALSVRGYRRPVVADARQWSDPEGGLARSDDVWGWAERR
jgi:sugar phosphate isomerase/epimerase